MPTYAILYIFFTTYLALTPLTARLSVTLVTVAITLMLPAIGIVLLYKLRLISDPRLNDRRDRLAPYFITAACFMGEAFYLMRVHAPAWLEAFMVAGGIVLIMGAIINCWWKISGHAMGMGALTSIAIFVLHNGYSLWYSITLPAIVIILSGIVMSSRLVLERHTLSQLVAGYFLSILIMLIPLLYIF